MNSLRVQLEEEKTKHHIQSGLYPASTAFNTLEQSTTDHHPHQSRQSSSKKEEEGPTTCDVGISDGQKHFFESSKQPQQYDHSISNNFSVNSKCDPIPFSVSSTSSSVVEQKNDRELINHDEDINQFHHHHHHHHHHHYHNHHYSYQNNIVNQGNHIYFTILPLCIILKIEISKNFPFMYISLKNIFPVIFSSTKMNESENVLLN